MSHVTIGQTSINYNKTSITEDPFHGVYPYIWSAKTVWDKMGRSLNPWPKSSNIELHLFPCIPHLMKLSNRINFRSVRTDMVNQHSCRNLKFKLFIRVKENYNSERIFRLCKGGSRFPWPDGLVG